MIIKSVSLIIPTIKAAIAGDGPELRYLKQISKKLKIVDQISFIGYINPDDLSEYYSSGKIFVLTSETEGLPRTILESMACGTPVVSSNVGDISDLLGHSKESFLVNNHEDIIDYSRKIVRLLKDKEEYITVSNESRKIAKNHYSHDSSKRVWKNIIDFLS